MAYLDKELLAKCIDLISILCETLPAYSSDILNKSSIMNYIFVLLEVIIIINFKTNDLFLKQYVLVLIGDLCKTKNKKIEENFDNLVMLLIENLENSPSNRNDPNDVDKIHICSNSCWAIGLLSAAHSQKLAIYIDQIMDRLLKMLCVPRVNYTS